jgi:hypothetical protein
MAVTPRPWRPGSRKDSVVQVAVAALQIVGLGGAGDAGGRFATDDDELTLDDGGAGAADRLRCGRQDVPTVSFRVIALHNVGIAAGGERAAADGVQVAGVGGDGEVVAGHRDIGGVAPAGAVIDLRLGDRLLGVAGASAHNDDPVADNGGAAGAAGGDAEVGHPPICWYGATASGVR